MQSLEGTPVLKFHQDTLQVIRKLYGLDEPGAMADAIEILQEWIKMQNHFMKKDFSPEFLERLIIRAKGSIEQAKCKLDKMCTSKTLMPKYFINCDVKELDYLDVIEDACLPRMTQDHNRVYLLRNNGQEFHNDFFTNYYRRLIYILEYQYTKDYMAGVVIILDLRNTNMIAHLKKIGFIEMQQLLTMAMGCYGIRIKGIHIISSSKVVDALVAMLKQILSAKLAGRIYVHSTLDELYDHVEKDILPKDYGGSEISLTELHQQYLDILSSEEHVEYIKMMFAAGTNEANRQTDKYNEQILGMPGSFRVLRVD